MNELTEQQKDALNIIRWISTFLIVVCHILQGLDNDWAWVFNIGVQLFFILSGFLYGFKGIKNIKKFYYGRLIKIYYPFLIWILISVILLFIFDKSVITIGGIVKQIFLIENLPGLGHLWFMGIIAVCYMLLPFVDYSLNKRETFTICSIVLFSCILFFFRYDARFVWIALYYIGYFCGRYQNIQKPIWLIAFFIVVYLFLFTKGKNGIELFTIWGIQNNLIHAFGGLFLFFLMFFIFSSWKLNSFVSYLLSKGGGMRFISHIIYLFLGQFHCFIIHPVYF